MMDGYIVKKWMIVLTHLQIKFEVTTVNTKTNIKLWVIVLRYSLKFKLFCDWEICRLSKVEVPIANHTYYTQPIGCAISILRLELKLGMHFFGPF